MATVAIATLTWCGAASASERYAVLIGNNAGARGETPLRYAERDAEKMAEALRQSGGFRAENVVMLRGESVDSARHALLSINDRLRSTGDTDSLLFVYYSGHASSRALHFGDDELAIDELELLVRGSSAAFRVLVVDACRSGAITHVKGATPAPVFDVAAPAEPASEGYVVLTAAAAGEDAQEADALQGSFFTHHLVSGLLGAADADADAHVTLDEAYRYAFQQTVRASSETLAGTQHPTFRYDLRGKGDVVLTSLTYGDASARLASLAFPDDIDFLVFGADGRVVAEVSRQAPRRTLFVPAGSYEVRGRGRDALYEGRVDVAAQSSRSIELDELDRIAYARLVRKGGGAGSSQLQVGASLAAYTSIPAPGTGLPAFGLSVAVPVVLESFAIAPRLQAGGFIDYSDRYAIVMADIVVLHTFDFEAVSVDIGGFAGALASQVVTTFEGQTFRASHVGPSWGLLTNVELPIAGPVFAFAGVEVRTQLPFRIGDAVSGPSFLELGARAGAGSYF